MATLEHGGMMRSAHAGPLAALGAQFGLLAALAGTVGLGAAGWAVGVTSAVVANVWLAHAIVRYRTGRLGPATWVTLGRASLAVGVAGLTADSFSGDAAVAPLVALASVALAMDAVDGWVARGTGSISVLGARLDGEVDAFLMLVLSVYVASFAGWSVLAIGLMRYVFGVAGWPLPWMRAQLPRRDWRKVVTATQGIVLVIAASELLPLWLSRVALVGALAMLGESFGRDVWWLWRHRHVQPDPTSVAAVQAAPAVEAGRGRSAVALTISVLAVLVVWVALVMPNRLSQLTPSSFARIPIEGLVLAALATVLAQRTRRVVAWVAGATLGAVLLVKFLDIGFYAAFDRPFNPVDDWSYTGIGVETLQSTIGESRANLAVAAAVLGIVVTLVSVPLAMVRMTRDAAGHRRWVLQAVAVLGVAWVAFRAFDAPVASASAADLAVREVKAVRTGLEGRAVFARELRNDPLRDTPAGRLLTGLRDKDVLLVFIEAYGKVALEHDSISPGVRVVLRNGTKELRAAGFSSRSAFLTSSTFGGLSWLAHSSVHAGVWVDSQRRYNQLVTSDRFTLSQAFKRAGWRTVAQVPANSRRWPEGSTFYEFDQLYDRRNVGYRGPTFGYASMPDQYTLEALERLELAKPDRPPVFAEVDLVSSHAPWTRVPPLIDWDEVGDGSIFHRIAPEAASEAALLGESDSARVAYGRSIEYSLDSVFSFVERYGGDDLVLVVLGDHQPAAVITGEGASRDVPVSIIARDPAVFDRIDAWGWEDGLEPSGRAPVWRMDTFRDRFLRAYG